MFFRVFPGISRVFRGIPGTWKTIRNLFWGWGGGSGRTGERSIPTYSRYFRVFPCFSGFFQVFPGYSGFFQVPGKPIGIYFGGGGGGSGEAGRGVFQGIPGHSRFFQVHSRFFQVHSRVFRVFPGSLQGIPVFSRSIPGYSMYFRVFPGISSYSRVFRGIPGPGKPIGNYFGGGGGGSGEAGDLLSWNNLENTGNTRREPGKHWKYPA